LLGYPDAVAASRALAIRLVLAGCIGAAFVVAAAWFSFDYLGRPATGNPVRCITPSEIPAGSPVLLAWEGGGAPFRVTIENGSGERLWESGRLNQPLVEVPPEVAAQQAGEPLYWRVEGVDHRGRAFRAPACQLTLVAVQ
jgi:hypothetical protein